jgi:5-hydroxyisourate hydrolase
VNARDWEMSLAHLTTHVLDTSRGIPAEGVDIELHVVVDEHRERVATATTTPDGRTALPLLGPESNATGLYELTFHIGDYFRRSGVILTTPPFLDQIVIRFGLGEGHHHVPLLVSPYGYSTYKGS